MRAALAIQVDQHKWGLGSNRAGAALAAELGDGWATAETDLGDAEVLDGVQGRGAASWIPIVEWLGIHAAGGVVGGATWKAVLASYRQLRNKVEQAREKGHRVRVSQGLAVMLAALYVADDRSEKEPLQLEFVAEPSYLAGRPITETSYTGFEPWLVSLVDRERKNRYLLVVGPEGDIQGCVVTPIGQFEAMFSPVQPPEEGLD